jgi:hypothetical protein
MTRLKVVQFYLADDPKASPLDVAHWGTPMAGGEPALSPALRDPARSSPYNPMPEDSAAGIRTPAIGRNARRRIHQRHLRESVPAGATAYYRSASALFREEQIMTVATTSSTARRSLLQHIARGQRLNNRAAILRSRIA